MCWYCHFRKLGVGEMTTPRSHSCCVVEPGGEPRPLNCMHSATKLYCLPWWCQERKGMDNLLRQSPWEGQRACVWECRGGLAFFVFLILVSGVQNNVIAFERRVVPSSRVRTEVSCRSWAAGVLLVGRRERSWLRASLSFFFKWSRR